jgi:hypothetical protein
MGDFRDLARDPAHRRRFEKLLYLAARRGDADLVAERLSWGIDPDCTFSGGRSPLIANVRGSCPSAATVRALLEHGADPNRADAAGFTGLDHALRNLARLQSRLPRRRRKSPSLDETDQLRLGPQEQAELDTVRRRMGGDRDYLRMWWQERLRAARRVFDDPAQLEEIVELMEAAGA